MKRYFMFFLSGLTSANSSPATATTIGSMAIPEMVRRGYNKSLALGATAAGGTLGIVITDTSIGHLFMAGIVPGLLLATLLSLTIVVIVIPMFIKTIVNLGYDPVWFGVVVTIQSEIAATTPPVGFNLCVLKSVVPGVQLQDVARGSVIFVIPMLIAIVILTAFSQIALFLPQLLLAK